MSAPQPLSEPQRLRILTSHYHLGRRAMVRFWHRSEEDLTMVEERRRREHHRLDLAVPLCLLGYPPVGRGGRRSGLRRSWWNWLPDRWGRILQRCKPTPRGQKPVANTWCGSKRCSPTSPTDRRTAVLWCVSADRSLSYGLGVHLGAVGHGVVAGTQGEATRPDDAGIPGGLGPQPGRTSGIAATAHRAVRRDCLERPRLSG